MNKLGTIAKGKMNAPLNGKITFIWKSFFWVSFSFSRYLNFCLDFLVIYKKRLDWKEKVNFKVYSVTVRLTNS